MATTRQQDLSKGHSAIRTVWWCCLTISSFVIPFSSCLQSFSPPGSFPVTQLFASGGQSTGASASASVLPMNIQGWFPLGLTGLISLQSKGFKKIFLEVFTRRNSFKIFHDKVYLSIFYCSYEFFLYMFWGYVVSKWKSLSHVWLFATPWSPRRYVICIQMKTFLFTLKTFLCIIIYFTSLTLNYFWS